MKKSPINIKLKILQISKRGNFQIEVSPYSDVGPIFSSSIEKAASAFDPNIVFVQAPNPELHREGVRVRVSILSNNNRVQCQIKCTEVSC